MAQNVTSIPLVLNSWKEIAAYVGRGVRTVQRWERLLALPVHRIGKGKRSPVYAYAKELNFWRMTSGYSQNVQPSGLPNSADVHGTGSNQHTNRPVEQTGRLLKEIHTSVQTVAETSARQRRQTEILQNRLLEIRSRLKRNPDVSS